MADRFDAFKLVNAQSLAASFNSNQIEVNRDEIIGVHLIWTGTPAGTFAIQLSGNPNPSSSNDWASYDLDPVPTPAGADGNHFVDIGPTGAAVIRVAYTRTSGTGSLDCWVIRKSAGGE